MAAEDFLSELPILGALFDNSEEDIQNQLLANKAELMGYSPEDIFGVSYDPSLATGSLISEDPESRSMQMEALNRLRGLADEGVSAQDRAVFREAANAANQQARGQSEAALQNAQNRGVAGSGMEFALRQAGEQDAANRMANVGAQQAATSAAQRAAYNQSYLQGAGDLRSADYQKQAANADIMNRFNMANQSALNSAKEFGAQSGYNAQAANQGAGMDFAGMVAGQNNEYSKYLAARNAARAGARAANTAAAAKGIGAAVGGV